MKKISNSKKGSENQEFSGHFFPKGKKGVELPLNTVVVAIIVLIVVVVVIFAFTKLFNKGTGGLGEQIDALGDEDGDNIANMFDKCPCDPGEKEFDGCKSEKEPTTGYKKNIEGSYCTQEQKEAYKIS